MALSLKCLLDVFLKLWARPPLLPKKKKEVQVLLSQYELEGIWSDVVDWEREFRRLYGLARPNSHEWDKKCLLNAIWP